VVRSLLSLLLQGAGCFLSSSLLLLLCIYVHPSRITAVGTATTCSALHAAGMMHLLFRVGVYDSVLGLRV
jgi:hypothetical protein